MTPTREEVIRVARECGFKASIGKTDKEGNYHPNVNALSKDVPVEWVESIARHFYEAALLAADAQRPALKARTEDAGKLKSLLGAALGALKYHTEQTRPIERTRETIDAIERELVNHGIGKEQT